MTKKALSKILLLTALISFTMISCTTVPGRQKTEGTDLSETTGTDLQESEPYLSRNLIAEGQLTPAQLTRFFMTRRPDADVNEILNFAVDYVIEAKAEGINSDVAFAQMCLETGYLRFGNLVQPEMHNYCGLGAMDAEHPGEYFETRTLGIRAHIQHLQAYATKEETKLNQELVDPRYNWVHKTKYVETIEGLTGTWATDPKYAEKIENNLQTMEKLFPKK